MRPALALATQPTVLWALLLALSTLLQWVAIVRLARSLFLESAAEPLEPAASRAGRRPAWPAWAWVAAAIALQVMLAVSGRFAPPVGPAGALLPGG
jgi:hypothetical protein